jgi:hypothetical protein
MKTNTILRILGILVAVETLAIVAGFIHFTGKTEFYNKMISISFQKENLMLSEVRDMRTLASVESQARYDDGYRKGKNDVILTLMDKSSLGNYSEGYHAALSQFSNEIAKGRAQAMYENPEIIPVSLEDTKWAREDIEKIRREIDIAITKELDTQAGKLNLSSKKNKTPTTE